MRVVLGAIALLFVATPAMAQSVDVGQVDWAKFPKAREKESRLDYADLAGRVENVLRTEKCAIGHATPRQFDITVPYAVLIQPDGKVSRVVVSRMNCTGLETLVGQAVIARSDVGDYLPTGEARPRWYVSALNFNQQ